MSQHNAFGVLTPQNYHQNDYADRLISRGRVMAPLYLACLASPHLGAVHVHSVPVSYSQARGVKQNIPAGMGTPHTPALI